MKILVKKISRTVGLFLVLVLVLATASSALAATAAGNALRFAGGSQNVLATLGTSFAPTELTVEFWMKSSDTANNGTPFSYATASVGNMVTIYNYRNFRVYINGQATTDQNVSANDGLWHHIAMTWRSSDGQVILYKDGAPVLTQYEIAKGFSIPAGGTIVLGQDQDSLGGGFETSQAFKGDMDQIRIWNKVRTQEEINIYRYAALPGTVSNLRIAWNCNEASGNILDYASVGGSISGTLTGVTRVASTAPISAIFYVTNGNDDLGGSLRWAIEDSWEYPEGTIIDITGFNGTITLNRPLPLITLPMKFYGSGKDQLTISGNNLSRVFFVHTAGKSVEFHNLTIANGMARGGAGGPGAGGGAGMGGALFVNAGNVTLDHVAFLNNSAAGGAGGDNLSYNGIFLNAIGGGGGAGGAGGLGGPEFFGIDLVRNKVTSTTSPVPAGGGGGGGLFGAGGNASYGGGGGGGLSSNGGKGGTTSGGAGAGAEGGAGGSSSSINGSQGQVFGGGGGTYSNGNLALSGLIGGGGGDFGGGGGSAFGQAGSGGFGGGGGGSAGILDNSRPGNGGFGGGAGGSGVNWGTGHGALGGEFGGNTIDGDSAGAGGAGLGGAIFVRSTPSGGAVKLIDSELSGNTVSGGLAGVRRDQRDSFADGSTAGADIFSYGGTAEIQVNEGTQVIVKERRS